MSVLLRLALWNVVFAVALVSVVFVFAVWVEYYFPGVGRRVADIIGLGVPGILAVWVLILGSRYATGRAAVIGCAAGASILLLVQSALLAFLLAWSKGFGGRTDPTTTLELLLAAVLIVGAVLVWRFVHAKRSAAAERER